MPNAFKRKDVDSIYAVTIEETVQLTVLVAADSEDEAAAQVESRLRIGAPEEIDMFSSEYLPQLEQMGCGEVIDVQEAQ